MMRRHDAAITATRLLDALERWPNRLTLDEQSAMQLAGHALTRIATEDRVGWALQQTHVERDAQNGIYPPPKDPP